MLAALALTVAAGAAALVMLRDGADAPQRSAKPAPTPAPTATPSPTPEVTTIRDVGFRPRGVVVANRHAWVISSSLDRVTSIDVESGEEDGPQPVVGRGAADIAHDENTLWVASRRRRAVLGISLRTGNVVRHLTTPLPPIRVEAGPSGLWVVGREAPEGPAFLYRYDREGSGPQLYTREFADGIAGITLGGGYLWLALEQNRRVVRVARDADPEHAGWLTSPAYDLTYGAGYLWASVRDDESVMRIDPRSTLTRTVLTVRHPAQIAVAGNRVFVASHTAGSVVGFDAKRPRRAMRLHVPANPYALAAAAGRVWVTGQGANTLTRIDLRP